MAATEAALAHKTAGDLTIQEIASEVGVDAKTVNYYFGGKCGLMEAMSHEIIRDSPYCRYSSISYDCISQKSIRPLIEELADFYYSRPALLKIHFAYYDRSTSPDPKFVKNIIEDLINAGIYKRNFDMNFLIASILGTLTAPLFATSDKANIRGKLRSPEWIDHVSTMIDLPLMADLRSLMKTHDQHADFDHTFEAYAPRSEDVVKSRKGSSA
jgi:AcrR family transcriptional regulator